MKNDSCLISVILSNYNYGKFLNKAISSVLEQTYEKFELIIVDDGSTDRSNEVILSYSDPRIVPIFKKNGGQSSAFNLGFSQVKGDIVCFLDSDDWWKSEKLETLIRWHNFLKGNYSIIQHGLDIWENGEITPYKHILPVGDCFAEMIKTGRKDFFVPTSGLSFKKKTLDKIFPIPPKFRIAADSYLMRTAFVFGDVYSIPESLGFYRKHDNIVFGNPQFNANSFFKNQLYPELNDFYKKNGFTYEIHSNHGFTSVVQKVKRLFF